MWNYLGKVIIDKIMNNITDNKFYHIDRNKIIEFNIYLI